MARRRVEVFSLSFLDVICCGFGAVILFFSVISARQGIERTTQTDLLAAEVSRVEEEVLKGARNLVELKNALKKTESETVSATSRAAQLIEELQRKREESFIYDSMTLAKRERIERLMADVKALEEGARRIEAGTNVTGSPQVNQEVVRTPESARYITGLALNGKRILILVDQSASMLHDDYVEIFRLRSSSPQRRQAEAYKWRWTLDIVSWLISEVPESSQFQVHLFNTSVEPLLSETNSSWLSGNDAAIRRQLVNKLFTIEPSGGTSLINALQSARLLRLPPDQIVLITDGLPTQEATPPALRRYVDAKLRARYFDSAVRTYNLNAPVEIILMPMKGDVDAPFKYWEFARKTKGSFLTPSVDWP